MNGRETPKNGALTILKGFSTVSLQIFDKVREFYLGDFKEELENPAQPLLYS
jgi:hypothetical protein